MKIYRVDIDFHVLLYLIMKFGIINAHRFYIFIMAGGVIWQENY